MNKERALITALEIIDTCRTYGNEERCIQCPFNMAGDCILTDGNNIPTDWIAARSVDFNYYRKDKK